MVWIRICCVCAMLFAAFAHQPVAADEGSTAISRYSLPDGTVLSLCVYVPAGENAAVAPPCEFCRIVDGAFFSPPCTNCVAITRSVESKKPGLVSVVLPQPIFRPATPLRGPPAAV